VIAKDSGVWKHRDDVVTDSFQPPRHDLSQCSHDYFRLYPGGFNTYCFEHLDLFYEENFEPAWCSNFNEGKDMIFLK
jgi:hypothetical protein